MGVFDWLRKGTPRPSDKVERFPVDFEFNTRWVSLDYSRTKTADIIRNLAVGAPIYFRWSDVAFRDGEHIQVLDPRHRQIGWVPAYEDESTGDLPFAYKKLTEGIKAGWPIDAKVKLTGRVDDPEKYVWWCVVRGQVLVPFAATDVPVFAALQSNRYHLDPACGTAKKVKVPLQVAEGWGRIPCPKCAQQQK